MTGFPLIKVDFEFFLNVMLNVVTSSCIVVLVKINMFKVQSFICYHHCNISGNMMKSVRNLLKDRDLVLFTYLVMYPNIVLYFNCY